MKLNESRCSCYWRELILKVDRSISSGRAIPCLRIPLPTLEKDRSSFFPLLSVAQSLLILIVNPYDLQPTKSSSTSSVPNCLPPKRNFGETSSSVALKMDRCRSQQMESLFLHSPLKLSERESKAKLAGIDPPTGSISMRCLLKKMLLRAIHIYESRILKVK